MEQTLPENVISLMKSLDFIGTYCEYECLSYFINCIIDKENPYIEHPLLTAIVKRWENIGWITLENDIVVSMHEGFIDRAFKIIKEFGKSYIIEKSFHHSYVLVEGPDCSGKTSLMTELWKDKDLSQFYIYDRWIISDEVYAKKFKRKFYKNVDIDTYLSYHKQRTSSLPNLKIIHCTADAYTLADRCILKNDPLVEGKTYETIVKELASDRLNFDYCIHRFCEDYNIQLLEIDTSEKPLEDCVKLAKQFILGDNNGN